MLEIQEDKWYEVYGTDGNTYIVKGLNLLLQEKTATMTAALNVSTVGIYDIDKIPSFINGATGFNDAWYADRLEDNLEIMYSLFMDEDVQIERVSVRLFNPQGPVFIQKDLPIVNVDKVHYVAHPKECAQIAVIAECLKVLKKEWQMVEDRIQCILERVNFLVIFHPLYWHRLKLEKELSNIQALLKESDEC